MPIPVQLCPSSLLAHVSRANCDMAFVAPTACIYTASLSPAAPTAATHRQWSPAVAQCSPSTRTRGALTITTTPRLPLPSPRRRRQPAPPSMQTLPDGQSPPPPPPINLPSTTLLLTSCVLAIASVGCVFELSSGHPTYGQTLTSAILAVSLPGFLFLFYAAIRKGQQEALDDP